MTLIITPMPSGGATHLKFSVPASSTALIVATRSSTPPVAPLIPGTNERTVVNSSTVTRDDGNGSHFLLDDHRDLQEFVITYHLYAVTAGVPGSPSSVTVDVRNPTRTAFTPIVRDFVSNRLEYHVRRAIRDGIITVDSDHIAIHETEVLPSTEPLPMILLKESWNETSSSIGELSVPYEKQSDGSFVKQRSKNYNVRIDLLLIADNPGERTNLATFLTDAFEIDRMGGGIFDAKGLRETKLSRSTQSAVFDDGSLKFGEELTLQGTVRTIVLETRTGTVITDVDTTVTVSTDL